jgi:hypothetical protein
MRHLMRSCHGTVASLILLHHTISVHASESNRILQPSSLNILLSQLFSISVCFSNLEHLPLQYLARVIIL